MKDVIIIGGGASGIIAAIFAARNGAKVTLLERLDRIGKKILATGNGRCNLTNHDADVNHYHTSADINFIHQVLLKFSVERTLRFFEELGIEAVEKEEGKIYPRSEQAASVLNVLIHELDQLKVQVLCGQEVEHIFVRGKGEKVEVKTKTDQFSADSVILATGGKASPDLGSDGSGFRLAKELLHNVTNIFPSLVQLKTDFPYLKQLQGTKVNGSVTVLDSGKNHLRSEQGEILFTDYGISGPPVLQVSRQAVNCLQEGTKPYIRLDIMEEYSEEELLRKLMTRFERMPLKSTQEVLVGFLNNRLILPVLKLCAIDIHQKAGEIGLDKIKSLASNLKNIEMKVIGHNPWNQAQVTAGGVSLTEIDPSRMRSKKHPSIYFCGEILDVDGDCGGYNLQWAFSSGAIAGISASKGGIEKNAHSNYAN